MMNVPSEKVEQPLAELLQATTQAHFLHALTVPEALVVLRERHKHLWCLLQGDHEQARHPSAVLLLDHFHLLLAAELAWVERTIVVLQKSDGHPEAGREHGGSAERRVSREKKGL